MRNNIIKHDSKIATIHGIINRYAGSPIELTRQFEANGLRYSKVSKGSLVKYVVRAKDRKDNFKLIVKL